MLENLPDTLKHAFSVFQPFPTKERDSYLPFSEYNVRTISGSGYVFRETPEPVLVEEKVHVVFEARHSNTVEYFKYPKYSDSSKWEKFFQLQGQPQIVIESFKTTLLEAT